MATIDKPTVSIIGTDTRDALTAAFEAGKATKSAAERLAVVEGPEGARVPVQLTDAGGIKVLTEVIAATEQYGVGPRRRSGTVRFSELDSLIAYLLRYGNRTLPTIGDAPIVAGLSVVFADLVKFSIAAVLDYHPPGPDNDKAGWQGHRAVYECPRSRQWKEWTALDGVDQTQSAFGEFIEAHAEDVRADGGMPSGLDLLELARNLAVHSKGIFERRTDPRTGEGSLICKEEHADTSTPIPRAFTIGVQIFEGGAMYLIECRVRFALRNGTPIFSFHMHRRADFERDAFMDVRKELAEKTGLPIFAGTPEV